MILTKFCSLFLVPCVTGVLFTLDACFAVHTPIDARMSDLAWQCYASISCVIPCCCFCVFFFFFKVVKWALGLQVWSGLDVYIASLCLVASVLCILIDNALGELDVWHASDFIVWHYETFRSELKELGMSKTKLAWRKEVVLKQLMASFHQGASGPNLDNLKLSECKGLRLFMSLCVCVCVTYWSNTKRQHFSSSPPPPPPPPPDVILTFFVNSSVFCQHQ